jgi:hypothetical protein
MHVCASLLIERRQHRAETLHDINQIPERDCTSIIAVFRSVSRVAPWDPSGGSDRYSRSPLQTPTLFTAWHRIYHSTRFLSTVCNPAENLSCGSYCLSVVSGAGASQVSLRLRKRVLRRQARLACTPQRSVRNCTYRLNTSIRRLARDEQGLLRLKNEYHRAQGAEK